MYSYIPIYSIVMVGKQTFIYVAHSDQGRYHCVYTSRTYTNKQVSDAAIGYLLLTLKEIGVRFEGGCPCEWLFAVKELLCVINELLRTVDEYGLPVGTFTVDRQVI